MFYSVRGRNYDSCGGIICRLYGYHKVSAQARHSIREHVPSEMWKSMSGMAEKLTIGFGAEGFTPITQAELTEQFSRIEAELRQLTMSNQRLDEEYSFSEE